MNALAETATHAAAAAADPTRDTVVPLSSARRYLERSAGTGYGRSSGYASNKRYTSDWGQPRFRCA
jgi:hypothetical protein